jgi:proteic killer suppression protein
MGARAAVPAKLRNADALTRRPCSRLARAASSRTLKRRAYRRLVQLDAASKLSDLRGKSFSLEALEGDRVGQHSIRINRNLRVCFVWRMSDETGRGDAYNVEIVDYH